MVRLRLTQFVLGFSFAVALLLFGAGCATTQSDGVYAAVDPELIAPVEVTHPTPTMSTDAPAHAAGTFNVGDLVIVNFSGLSDTVLQPHEERIKEDGTITLPQIGPVKAVGKTTGELQKEIRSKYVDGKYFKADLNVTVKGQERYFFVSGEVNRASSYVWSEGMTVLKAIASAGGFNDFADRTEVTVTRADGRQVVINCKKAQRDPKLDLPVYPGDNINVPRGFL